MHRPSVKRVPRNAVVRPAGFTLVEMLVSLTIFLILAALTLGAFRGVNKDDQISAGAQQVKGWFEHARSKALRDKQPRGLRFLPELTTSSGTAPRLCTSVAYIGGAGYEDGDLSTTLTLPERKYAWVQPVTLNGMVAGSVISPGGAAFNRPSVVPAGYGYATYVAWQAAMESGAVTDATAQTHGLRIEIPRNSGNWYPILYVGEDRNKNGTLDAGEDLNVSEDTSPTLPNNPMPVPGLPTGRLDPVLVLAKPVENAIQYLNQPVDYRIELGPTLLADKANPLPRGIVIDLDASYIPWRPSTFGGAYPQVMDVMFDSSGRFVGQLAAAQGVLHLCVSTLEDANDARRNFPTGSTPHPHPEMATATADVIYPFLLADSKTTQKLVSVFLNSGRVASSNLFNFASGDPSADGVNNTRLGTAPGYSDVTRAFGYAVQGKESK